MRTTFVATQAISAATRQSILRMQSELVAAQKELATGRHADVGLALGAHAGRTVSLRQEHARLQGITDTNGIVTARLDATQAALAEIAAGADAFVSTLIDRAGSEDAGTALSLAARTQIEALVGSLNGTQSGEYIFAGINTDVKPVADYFGDPPSPAKQAVDAAFFATFGFAQDDPAVATITGAAMQNFLDTTFAALFEPAAWSATWSSASDENIRSRISPGELIETGTSANSVGMRQLAMAYTMVLGLGAAQLSPEALQAVTNTALSVAGGASQQLTLEQGRIGSAQERVVNANERMSIQRDILAKHVSVLEAVDPFEASTRVNTLMTQIETAYALTAQIQRLSILNYL
jgi:flagellar hook-associated protein 3 FlgL